MTLDDLNSRDRRGFVEAVGWVFEHSSWVADRVWTQRPFHAVDALHDAMVSQVSSATPEEQQALLHAHPDLGTVRLKPDRREMSETSKREQAGAGLGALTRAELDRLFALNAAYRDKFGFPFVYAVRGATKQDILNALEVRLLQTREAELSEALQQVYRIARYRLEEIFVVRQP